MCGGESLLPSDMDPGGVLTSPFPTDIEYEGELLLGIEWSTRTAPAFCSSQEIFRIWEGGQT